MSKFNSQQLIPALFEAVESYKPGMSVQERNIYLIGLLAEQVTWAANNDINASVKLMKLFKKLQPVKYK
jgi:hypothetical protein